MGYATNASEFDGPPTKPCGRWEAAGNLHESKQTITLCEESTGQASLLVWLSPPHDPIEKLGEMKGVPYV